MRKLILILCLFYSTAAAANNVYIANASAGANDGSSCANAKAASYFNTVGNWSATPSGIQIGPDTTVHLCGTISTTMTRQGSGSNGHPVTILFETGAKISQALCPSTGCLVLDNGTDFVVDGAGTGSVALGTFVSNGLIENTASGSSLANTNPTTYGISAGVVNRVTVKNLLCQNVYVMIANSGTPISDSSTARCMSYSGSNITINNNVAHDCGWCFYDVYKNGDTNVTFSNNEVSAFSHALAIATSTSNAVAGDFFVFNNKFHDSSNWAVGGCGGMHVDALHIFATGGATLGNTLANVYFHDNHMYGSYGTCASAHFFVEGGADRANMVNGWFFNNVSQVPNGAVTISWHEIFSAITSAQYINNTIQGPGNADNTFCANIGSTHNTTIKNNVFTGCGGQINVGSLTGATNIDYNFYDTTCNSGNCWVFNGSFVGGTFAAWKTACSCDSHGKQNAAPLLNADGTPQNNSPVIKQADNLGSIAIGNLVGLQTDSSNGGIRVQFARPASGSCSSQGNLPCWDMGAFQFGSPALIACAPSPAPFGPILQNTPSPVKTITCSNIGGQTETLNTPYFTITGPNAADFANVGGSSCSNGLAVAPSTSCTWLGTFTPATGGAESATLNINGTASTSVALSGNGVPPSTNPAPTPQILAKNNPATITLIITGCPVKCTITLTCVDNCSTYGGATIQ